MADLCLILSKYLTVLFTQNYKSNYVQIPSESGENKHLLSVKKQTKKTRQDNNKSTIN